MEKWKDMFREEDKENSFTSSLFCVEGEDPL